MKTQLSMVFLIVASLLAACSTENPDPEQVARDWVESNVDVLGEEVSEAIVGENVVLRGLGGEAVERAINSVVTWSYEPHVEVAGEVLVIATAAVSFEVDVPLLGQKNVAGEVPFNLYIDGDRVDRWLLDSSSIRLSVEWGEHNMNLQDCAFVATIVAASAAVVSAVFTVLIYCVTLKINNQVVRVSANLSDGEASGVAGLNVTNSD